MQTEFCGNHTQPNPFFFFKELKGLTPVTHRSYLGGFFLEMKGIERITQEHNNGIKAQKR